MKMNKQIIEKKARTMVPLSVNCLLLFLFLFKNNLKKIAMTKQIQNILYPVMTNFYSTAE